jgi:predicted amidohydrolase
LIGDISTGLDSESTGVRLREIVEGVDASVFLRLRSFWADLAVAGVVASGPPGILTLANDFGAAAEAISLTPDAPQAQFAALLRGIRAAWIFAVAQAFAVAMSAEERRAFAKDVPRMLEDSPVEAVSTPVISAYAARLRARGLVPAQFVSVPLSEFTTWSGPLLGAGVLHDFVEWASSRRRLLYGLQRRVARAVRFVQLHEACLAVHLWVKPGSPTWLTESFEILRKQPLLRTADLEALQAISEGAVCDVEPQLPPEGAERLLQLRVAMPSLRVRPDQLEAIITNDRALEAQIISEARQRTQVVVRAAAKRHASILVLPEWAVRPEQLGWLMNQSRRAEMLLVAGQAPTIRGLTYSNQIWTGIPLRDHANRRACLVPPPREKRYLSPHEQTALAPAGISHTPGTTIPTYRWRGIGVASLICFEFADVATRHALRRTTDLLTVSSWNQDWRYFDAIQEATTRDNYCMTFCVNTSDFPGTRLMRPTRSEKAVLASVHGSDYPAVVMRKVDLLPVVAARATGRSPSEVLTSEPSDDATLEDYKPVPPIW